MAAELRGAGDAATLQAAEAQCVQRAVAKRVQQFAAGRACARLLLNEWGVRDFALRVGEDRQPQWPERLTGSITHTDGFCAVAVADRTRFSGIGIDSEVSGSVKPALWPSICLPAEIAWLHTLDEPQQAIAATLIFSAKEAFYKCQFPVAGEKLNFHDAVIEAQWGSEQGSFTVRAPGAAIADNGKRTLQGRYLFHEEFVTTAIALR